MNWNSSQGGQGPAQGAAQALTVLQVVPKLNAGGVERGALEVAQAIIEAGGRAIVASEGGRMERQFAHAGATVIKGSFASKNPVAVSSNAKRLQEIIQTEGVDVVHARSRAPAWSAYLAVRRSNVGFVTTYHGIYKEDLPLKRRYNSVMAKGDIVIAISDHVANLVRERHKTPDERLVTIPRGADLSAFAQEQIPAPRIIALADEWGVSEDHRPVLLMPGRLTRWKGQTFFLEAVAQLKQRRGADFLALIVGGPDKRGARYADELAEAVHKLQLEDCVKMVGHCEDMPAAYRMASVVVSASQEPEAFGRVSVEAQAMGVPIVASAHGGSLETVADGETGWLYPPHDAAALMERLDHALSLPVETRNTIGAAGVERVHAHYSTASMRRATLEVYERAAGRGF